MPLVSPPDRRPFSSRFGELQRFYDLASMGYDMARLGFYRWLVDQGHDPEWRLPDQSDCNNTVSP